MAQPNHALSCYGYSVIFLCLFVAIFPVTKASGKGEGFSLVLIHRDSPHAPFYPGNLTNLQQMQRLFQFSRSSAQGANVEAIRPRLLQNELQYMVHLTIGTGPGQRSYYLVLDTGSNLTWIQCDRCAPKFNQSAPIFKPSLSPTYRLVSCNDPLCRPPFRCIQNKCVYNFWYVDGNSVKGCTHESHIDLEGMHAGIIGMDGSLLSAAVQLAGHTDGRFSYCLWNPVSGASGFLRFGSDIVMRGTVQRTPFLRHEGAVGEYYYVDLEDISINDRRLHIDPRTFSHRQDRTGGVIIDSGCPITLLIRPAYNRVIGELHQHFSNMLRVNGSHYGLNNDLCYKLPSSFHNLLPTMTFHFRGAPLRIRWQELFYVDLDERIFCLMIGANDHFTLLGAFQQYNTRFTFDVRRWELSFVAENCAHDGHS